MNVGFLIIVLILGGLTGCSSRLPQWTPKAAVADAQHDIASGHIRFAYVGGFVPFAPGVPEGSHESLQRYDRLKVGPQGCVQDKHAEERQEYARRYNETMWVYVSRQR
jgi:hypothetical protein